MTSPLSGRPLPSSFDENEDFYNESGFQKIMRRVKKEPLVPFGCLLTVAAFTNAYFAMRKGDHHQVQRMFRARVIAQSFTVCAMVAGGLYFGADRHKERELWKVQEEEKAEERRQRWIRELEARDEEEKELKSRLEKRKEKKKAADTEALRGNFRAAEAKKTEAEHQKDDEAKKNKAAVNKTEADAQKTQAEAGPSQDDENKANGPGWGVPTWLGGSKTSADDEKQEPRNSESEPNQPKK